MAAISVNGRRYEDIQLIAFDKDGTLVDFHRLWGEKSRHWLNLMVGRAGDGRDGLYQFLCLSLGYDSQTNRIVNDSPLAVASVPKLQTIGAAVLYRGGLGWEEAEKITAETLAASLTALPTADLIQPIGRVKATMARLAQAGLHLVIVTSDDRAGTEATLPLLGIEPLISLLVCGDDNQPNKPAPDALWLIGRQLNIKPAQMLMVGDTASDMRFGQNAGLAGVIGIRGGAGDAEALTTTADVVVDSIDSIVVI
jgi:phosphoglycolate phosphatase-like HAD superfamily hydrolase